MVAAGHSLVVADGPTAAGLLPSYAARTREAHEHVRRLLTPAAHPEGTYTNSTTACSRPDSHPATHLKVFVDGHRLKDVAHVDAAGRHDGGAHLVLPRLLLPAKHDAQLGGALLHIPAPAQAPRHAMQARSELCVCVCVPRAPQDLAAGRRLPRPASRPVQNWWQPAGQERLQLTAAAAHPIQCCCQQPSSVPSASAAQQRQGTRREASAPTRHYRHEAVQLQPGAPMRTFIVLEPPRTSTAHRGCRAVSRLCCGRASCWRRRQPLTLDEALREVRVPHPLVLAIVARCLQHLDNQISLSCHDVAQDPQWRLRSPPMESLAPLDAPPLPLPPPST